MSNLTKRFIEPIHTLKLRQDDIYNPLLNFTLYKEKEEPGEFLKVYEYNVGRKYLESTSTQNVYPDVYWVHKVDGQQVETYLSASQLRSFECDTLTAQYSTTTIDGVSVQYVYCYQIDSNSNFGEHHFKITYVSPDTNNILSVKYSCYYLEEESFEFGDSINWYPFRNFLEREPNLGYAKLNFKCIADNGDIITSYSSISRNTSYICYDFPTIPNADFKFAENQIVKYTYVSSYSLKEYTGNSIWNIRPYTDSRNNYYHYVGFLMREMETTEIKIKSNVQYYSDYTLPSDYTDMEDYYAQILKNATVETTDNVFEAPYISMNFSDYNISVAYYQLSYPASIGYIYWGDGTFSYYAAGKSYYSSTSSISGTYIENVKILNGYKLVNGVKVRQDIYPYKNANTHTYDTSGEYTVVITSAYASELRQNSSGVYQTCVPICFGKTSTDSYSTSMKEWTKPDNYVYPFISGGTVTSYTPNKDFVLPLSPASAQVQEIKIGDGCFVGVFRYVQGNYSYTWRGDFYGKFNSDKTDGVLIPYIANDFVNMSTLKLPKMFSSLTPSISKDFFRNSKSLKNIYYNGTMSDFQKVFGTNGEYIDTNYYFKGIGDNATFRSSGGTYTFDVICTDGTLNITV